METTKDSTKKAKTLSEHCGVPAGSFNAFMIAKKNAIERINQNLESRVREAQAQKLTWG